MAEQLLSAQEVSRRVKWNLITVYTKAKAGMIPGVVRFGKSVRFRESVIEGWLSKGDRGPSQRARSR